MKLVDMTCPNCGSKLAVDKDNKECRCESCGAIFMLDDGSTTQHIQYDNAEEAGYQFEKGRQKAAQEHARTVNYNSSKTNTPPKKPLPIWLWIILWTCFLPFTLIYFIYKSQLPQKVKIVLIGIICGFVLLSSIKSCIDKSKEGTPSDSPVTEAVYEDTSITSNSNNISGFSDSNTDNEIEIDKYEVYTSMWFKPNVSVTSDISNDDVLFVSDNPEIATIRFDRSTYGNYWYVAIEGISEGDTYVYVTSLDGTVESDHIHVIVNSVTEVETINITTESPTVALGGSISLNVDIQPDDAEGRSLYWESSDTSIATVNENGIVTGISNGEATITATSSNGASSSCVITVDDSLRIAQLTVSRHREDDNNIGSDWVHICQINGETARNGDFTFAVGDTLSFFVSSTENDDNPDHGEASTSHTVTEEDFNNGFTVQLEVTVTENGGRNSGQSAHFITTFTFEVV